MRYSNTGYAVLGVIIERVSGKTYYDYIRDHVFQPAGMDRSGFFSPHNPVDNMAVGYTARNRDGSTRVGGRVSNASFIEPIGSPGGGAYSTPSDMIRFGEALLENTLVSEATRATLWTASDSSGQGAHYGFGFGTSNRGGLWSVGHNGGGPGIGADFKIFPDMGMISVVFTNYDSNPIIPISSELLRLAGRLTP